MSTCPPLPFALGPSRFLLARPRFVGGFALNPVEVAVRTEIVDVDPLRACTAAATDPASNGTPTGKAFPIRYGHIASAQTRFLHSSLSPHCRGPALLGGSVPEHSSAVSQKSGARTGALASETAGARGPRLLGVLPSLASKIADLLLELGGRPGSLEVAFAGQQLRPVGRARVLLEPRQGVRVRAVSLVFVREPAQLPFRCLEFLHDVGVLGLLPFLVHHWGALRVARRGPHLRCRWEESNERTGRPEGAASRS